MSGSQVRHVLLVVVKRLSSMNIHNIHVRSPHPASAHGSTSTSDAREHGPSGRDVQMLPFLAPSESDTSSGVQNVCSKHMEIMEGLAHLPQETEEESIYFYIFYLSN